MKDYKFYSAILAFSLSILGGESLAATISIDLDSGTPGVQSSRTLVLGDEYEFGVVFTGDGETQFDTFALDVLYSSSNGASSIGLHSPVAGMVADNAPIMALDVYGATVVNSGDDLTRGNLPVPQGYDDSLGSVGITSVGDMPYPVIGEGETIGLFNGSVTALQTGTTTLALSGFPFGVGAELSLGGESVPVTLEGAEITVVPLPAAVWLFITGLLALFGIKGRKGEGERAELNQGALVMGR
jgi:hypothetical protein